MAENEKITLKEQVALLPMSAGCYLFENSKGEVIYVGKAKHLRNRVRSYFVESRDHSAKVRVMVRQIASMRLAILWTLWLDFGATRCVRLYSRGAAAANMSSEDDRGEHLEGATYGVSAISSR